MLTTVLQMSIELKNALIVVIYKRDETETNNFSVQICSYSHIILN